jgi:hypothetical protein
MSNRDLILKSCDQFTLSYITTMLWAETDDESNPLDKNYSIEDLAVETLIRIASDCGKFQGLNAEDLESEDEHMAGHDFWLTRNHHGAGFWDGDYEKDKGERLTNSAHSFGELWPYVGDSGKIYF